MARRKDPKKVATPPRQPRRWGLLVLRGVIPLVVLTVAIGVFLALAKSRPDLTPRPVSEHAWPVMVAKVEITDHQPRLRLYGETVAGRQVHLRALVAGEVTHASAALVEGGVVRKGDEILKIDPFEFDTRVAEGRANVREAGARLDEINAMVALEADRIIAAGEQLELSRVDLERAVKLRKEGLVSQKAVDDRKIVVRDREQALEQRKSGLKIERAKAEQQRAILERHEAALRRARRALADTRLTAPFDAYVSNVNAEIGQMIGVNDRVATLIDRDRVDVRFNLSDGQFGRILSEEGSVIGRKLKVLWRVGETELGYDAVIDRVAAQISAASGGVQLFARITNNPERPLRPGAFVEVMLADRSYADVVRLPETALYGGTQVYVIEAGRLKARTVSLIGYSGGDILVRGALKPGEQVLTTRLSEAGDGVLVAVQ